MESLAAIIMSVAIVYALGSAVAEKRREKRLSREEQERLQRYSDQQARSFPRMWDDRR